MEVFSRIASLRKKENMSEAGKGEAGGEKMTKQEEKRREEQRQESWN